MPCRVRSALLAGLGLTVLLPAIAWAAPGIGAVALSSNVSARASAVSAPTIDAPVTAAAATDQVLSLTATAMDADAGDVLTIVATGAPPSLVFDHTPSASPATATLSGTLGAGDAGSFLIEWTVSDGVATASTTTALTVNTNSNPVIDAPASRNGAETVKTEFPVNVSDPDGDAVVSFTATPLPAGATFTVNALKTVGLFTWTPSLGQAGTYSINFTVQSGSPIRSATATTVLTIGPPNRPPVVTAPATVNGVTSVLITVNVTASDPDGDPITSLIARGTQSTPLPVGAVFTANGSNTAGTLTWTPAPDQNITVSIDFIATSGALPVSTVFVTKIVVRTDRAPVVTAPASVNGIENTPLSFTVTASDPDATPIASLNASGTPSGATFTANGANTSGTLAWTPSYSQAGSHPLVFTASNALLGSAATTITIANVDRAPAVSAPATQGGPEGAAIHFAVSAADPDGDAIASLAAAPLPLGATFAAGPGNVSGTFDWTPSFAQSGSYTVVFTASNTLSGSAATALEVTEQNRAPIADPNGPYVGVAGLPISFNGSGSSDPDGDALTYAWDFGDGGTATGSLATHTYSAGGSFDVTLTVTDNGAPPLRDDGTTTASVLAGYEARVFTTNANKTIRLASGKPRWCAQVEPVRASFSLSEIVSSSVALRYQGNQIPSGGFKTSVTADGDGNGIEEITFCFSKDDLRTLFAGVPAGPHTVTVTVTGMLSNGAHFTGDLVVDVFGGGGSLAATVTPNPLNPEALITFATKKPGPIRVRLYDLSGRLVRTLTEESSAAAGYHDVRVDGRGENGERLGSGVYFFRIESPDGNSAGRLSIMK